MTGPRVVVVTTSYPRWPEDHAGEFVAASVEALRRAGARTRVVAPAATGAQHVPDVRRVGGLGSALAYGGGIPDRLERTPSAWAMAPLLAGRLAAATIAEARHADRVVGHWLIPGAACAMAAAEVHRIPFSAVLHSGGVALAERLPFGRLIAARVARRAVRLVFTSDRLRSRFMALIGPEAAAQAMERTAVVPMGVDPDLLGPASARPAARRRLDVAGRFVVGFLGRCVPVKGLDRLIAAMSRMPNAVLAVAGEGPELDRARHGAAQAGVDLRALGPVEGSARSAFYAACDVLALPSIVLPSGRTEGTPVVVLEALTMGLPVVASDVGGVPEVLEDGVTGFVVPPGETAALADRLNRLATHPSLRRNMARAARAAGRRHRWDYVGPHLASLLLSS